MSTRMFKKKSGAYNFSTEIAFIEQMFNTTLIYVEPNIYKCINPLTLLYYNNDSNTIYKKKIIQLYLKKYNLTPLFFKADTTYLNDSGDSDDSDDSDDSNDFNDSEENIIYKFFLPSDVTYYDIINNTNDDKDDRDYKEEEEEEEFCDKGETTCQIIQINDCLLNKLNINHYNIDSWFNKRIPIEITEMFIKKYGNSFKNEINKIFNYKYTYDNMIQYYEIYNEYNKNTLLLNDIEKSIKEISEKEIIEINNNKDKNDGIFGDENCIICLSTYFDLDCSVISLLCGHTFCLNCIKQIKTKICPLCNKKYKTIPEPNILIMKYINNNIKRKLKNMKKEMYDKYDKIKCINDFYKFIIDNIKLNKNKCDELIETVLSNINNFTKLFDK